MTTEIDRLEARLDHLATLKDGWHNGNGLETTASSVCVARQVIRTQTWVDLRGLRLYPSDDGGLAFEFDVDSSSVRVEVTPFGMLDILAFDVDECPVLEGKGLSPDIVAQRFDDAIHSLELGL